MLKREPKKSAAQIKDLTENQQRDEIETLILEARQMLFDAEAVWDEIANLNVQELWLDELEILSINPRHSDKIGVQIAFNLNGFIKGKASAVIDADGNFSYTKITADCDLNDNVGESDDANDLSEYLHCIKMICRLCERWFECNLEYPFNICPDCYARKEQAWRVLNSCKICGNTFRSSLHEIEPNICHKCLKRGTSESPVLQNKPLEENTHLGSAEPEPTVQPQPAVPPTDSEITAIQHESSLKQEQMLTEKLQKMSETDKKMLFSKEGFISKNGQLNFF